MKLGILGMGEGRSLAAAALSEPGWELMCMCDLSEELLKRRTEEFGPVRTTVSYAEMLGMDDIEVIGIYTPDALHAEHVEQALAAGKHVIVTKPLMVGLQEADRLLTAQKRSGRQVMVGQSSRFYETAMRQRADYEAGRLGELITLETHYISDSRWFLEKAWSHKADFSWLYNFLIHPVDLAVWYLPEVCSVYAAGVVSAGSREQGIECPDAIKVILKDRAGRTAFVNGAYASPNFNFRTEDMISCTLRGTEGISRGGSSLLYHHKYTKTENATVTDDFSARKPYYDRFGNGTHHVGEYQNYLRYFGECLQSGRTPKPDLEEGVRTIRVMEAIRESMESGQAVRL